MFENYLDVYDIAHAVENGATVPIHHGSGLARIQPPPERLPVIDAEID